jgi:hypothetical protein
MMHVFLILLIAGDSTTEVSALVERWQRAQNSGDFAAYEALYDPAFQGIRRSGPKTIRLNRAGWLDDRRRMFRRPMKVTVSELKSHGLEVTFRQHFSQGDYEDDGEKTMLLCATPQGLRIVREELRSSQVTNPLLKDLPPALRAAFEKWQSAHLTELKKLDSAARYEVTSVDEPQATVGNECLVVGEREQAGSCHEGLRALSCSAKGEPSIVSERVLGRDCCDSKPCVRAPGDWMMRLILACQRKDAARLKVLGRGKSERKLCGMDFSPRLFSFECSTAWKHDKADCHVWAGGESYDFAWRQGGGQAWVSEVTVSTEDGD